MKCKGRKDGQVETKYIKSTQILRGSLRREAYQILTLHHENLQ